MAANTKEYKLVLNGVTTAISSIGELKEEIESLENQLDSAKFGSKEFSDLQRKLQAANTQMEIFEQSVEKLTIEQKLGTIAAAGESLAGAFSIATAASAAFGKSIGLSEEQVQKYQQSVETVLLALQGYKSLMEGLTGENLKNLKSMLGLSSAGLEVAQNTGKATLASKLFGSVTKTAIISTGIGIFLIALGAIISNFDTIKAKVIAFAKSFEPVNKAITFFETKVGGFSQLFSGALEAGKQFFKSIVTLGSNAFDVITSGFDQAARDKFLKDFSSFGSSVSAAFYRGVDEKNKELAEEATNKLLQLTIDSNKRLQAQQEASGKDSFAIRKKIADDELKLLKSQLKAIEDIESEDYQNKKKEVLDKESEITILVLAKRKELADKAKEIRQKDLQAELDILQAKLNAQKTLLDDDNLPESKRLKILADIRQKELVLLDKTTQQQLAQEDLTTKQKEVITLQSANKRLEIEKDYNQSVLDIQKEASEKQKELQKKNLDAQEKTMQESIRRLGFTVDDTTATEEKRLEALKQSESKHIELLRNQLLRRKSEEKLTNDELLALNTDYYNNIYEITVATEEKRKEIIDSSQKQISEKYITGLSEITSQTLTAVNTLISVFQQSFDSQIEVIDERIEKSKEKIDQLTEQYEEAADNINSLEEKLLEATGSQREAIIQQLEDEREKRAQLAAEREAEDARQKKSEAEKAKLQKETQKQIQVTTRLSQIATAVNQTATAVSAVQAGIEAIKSGSKVPFPGNIIAIVAALAAVVAAVASAKQLATKVKMADGGLLSGPSHSNGGIPVGNTGIEVEGNEYVTNKRATANNLSALETINRMGDKVRFKAVPVMKMETGGVIPDLNTTTQINQSNNSASEILSELKRLNQTNTALANRPVQVDVTEITKKQAQITNIKEYSVS
ncbi:hypothetical protein [Xanthocytophaga agilis]|uniref:Uncharacterized protein n=1 Tax=Xanthocytophaga agilis TaxID=3048010 RepID=A0AAE3QZ18_9BACT|nr:hypothetical protein [Xanthocytophaga agilis]MDJ1500669.1 hypothetical protein [Xanthocytophaga agilis]